jgi:hypothetical protein
MVTGSCSLECSTIESKTDTSHFICVAMIVAALDSHIYIYILKDITKIESGAYLAVGSIEDLQAGLEVAHLASGRAVGAGRIDRVAHGDPAIPLRETTDQPLLTPPPTTGQPLAEKDQNREPPWAMCVCVVVTLFISFRHTAENGLPTS